MNIEKIILTQFKNYESASFVFHEKLNCFVGRNGIGKTNLLDAIYYLCMCKSHTSLNDRGIVNHGGDFFRLEGHFFLNKKRNKIVAKVQPGKKKDIERNDVGYSKLSEHIGLLPVVIIVPDDTLMAMEGSEVRRKFIDNTLSQLDAGFLRNLIGYNKLLKQRNATLKKFAETRTYNPELLDIYDQQLLEPAQIIFEKRNLFIQEFQTVFQKYYNIIANGRETVKCNYQSKLSSNDLATLLAESREKDRILGRTTCGIHKDDLILKIDDYPLKKFGSQGQLKSFVLAMKLAQYDFLKKNHEHQPILLLDDIFDKLDEHRVKHLLELMMENDFGQVFITDTHENRVEEIVKNFGTDYKKFYIEEKKEN